MTTDSKYKSPTGRKKAAFIAAACALILGVGFAGGEIYFRLFSPPVDLMMWTGRKPMTGGMEEWAWLDAFSAYRPKPGLKLAEGKFVSEQGFVSTPPITKEKRPGEFRIAFFGESSTAGTGFNLRDDETWPARTIELLKKRYPGADITFINAAVAGYTTFESYGRFVERVRFYKPDVAVVNHGWNEMYYFSHSKTKDIEKWRTLPDGSWSLKSDVKIKTWEPMWIDDYIVGSQLLSRLRLFFSPDPNGEAAVVRDDSEDTSFDPLAVEVFRTNLRLMRDSAKDLGVEFFVCKQATTIVPSWKSEEMEHNTKVLHGFGFDDHVKAFAAIYKIVEEEIPADRVVDLTPLSGRSMLFFDHVHPTPKGAEEMAAIVAKSLESYIDAKGLFAPAPQ